MIIKRNKITGHQVLVIFSYLKMAASLHYLSTVLQTLGQVGIEQTTRGV